MTSSPQSALGCLRGPSPIHGIDRGAGIIRPSVSYRHPERRLRSKSLHADRSHLCSVDEHGRQHHLRLGCFSCDGRARAQQPAALGFRLGERCRSADAASSPSHLVLVWLALAGVRASCLGCYLLKNEACCDCCAVVFVYLARMASSLCTSWAESNKPCSSFPVIRLR
jgi:hypothetical protein